MLLLSLIFVKCLVPPSGFLSAQSITGLKRSLMSWAKYFFNSINLEWKKWSISCNNVAVFLLIDTNLLKQVRGSFRKTISPSLSSHMSDATLTKSEVRLQWPVCGWFVGPRQTVELLPGAARRDFSSVKPQCFGPSQKVGMFRQEVSDVKTWWICNTCTLSDSSSLFFSELQLDMQRSLDSLLFLSLHLKLPGLSGNLAVSPLRNRL